MRVVIAVAMLATFVNPSLAQSAAIDSTTEAAAVAWHCWYSPERGSSVACRLVRAPQPTTEPAAGAGAALHARIRNDPASLEDEVVLIPLYGPAVDMALVARLARAVMCRKQPSCVVEFTTGPRI